MRAQGFLPSRADEGGITMILGIELGSTRIKSVIIDNAGSVIATGTYSWENRLEKGFWTYSVEEIWHGLQESYADLKRKYESRFSKKLLIFSSLYSDTFCKCLPHSTIIFFFH